MQDPSPKLITYTAHRFLGPKLYSSYVFVPLIRTGDVFGAQVKRRLLLQAAAASLLGNPLQAAGDPRSSARFPGTTYKAYSRCLPDYLARLSAQVVRKRELALSKLTSAAAIHERQTWASATFWKLIGGKPEKTDLNVRKTGSFQRSGYRVEKLIYESRPNLFVTANLYLPSEQKPPFPAVLFQCGHYWTGKAYPSYQRCCQGLAKLGFAVLAFDPMGQGERIYYLNEAGNHSRLTDVDMEHTLPGSQYLLLGETASRFQVWDAIRSVDLLLSRAEVDPTRVASVGHSGGATLTMLLATVDPRLSAAAVCMGNTENVAADPFLPPGATDDAEQDLIGAGPLGFDRWDLLYPFAPKPLLIWPSDRDFFSTYSPNYIRNGWEEFQKLKRTYVGLGHEDHLQWADSSLPHALAYPDRLLIYNWFSRFLQGNSQPIQQEPAVKPEEDSLLWATDSGNVVRALHSATPFSLISSTKPERSNAPLTALIGVDLPGAVSCKTIAQVKTAHVNVSQLEVASEPEVTVPAFLLSPVGLAAHAPLLLTLDDLGAQRLWFESEVDDVIAPDCPIMICAADVRGIGTLTPQFTPGSAEYELGHEQEENYAWSSLFFGRPLVGQRVRDILCLLSALRRMPGTAGRPIHVAARDRLAFPALLAAALDPSITSLYLAGGLAAFSLVTQTEYPRQPLANFVPGWLKHTDIPEVLASLAPRKVVFAGPVDARGVTLDSAASVSIFSEALQRGNLRLIPAADWSAASLLQQAL